jgi:hypothetical protein
LPHDVDVDDLRRAMQLAASAWTYPTVACSNVRITVGTDSRELLAAQDGQSIVVFRASEWCHNARCGGARTFPLEVAAMTSTYATGTAPESDVELNAVSFDWGPDTAGHELPRADLARTLAHELGHALGLPDACGASHSGRPRPCSAPPTIMLAALLLERPTPVDIKALCALHPRESDLATAAKSGAMPSDYRGWWMARWYFLPGICALIAIGLVYSKLVAKRGVG